MGWKLLADEWVTAATVSQEATPKSVMRIMGIPGITLYHLKSHLQKYRFAKNRDHKESNKIEDTATTDYRPRENVIPYINENKTRPQFDNSRTMLQLQMEVQRKLQEQLEGKMKSESYRDPLLPQKNIQARKSEFVPNFTLLGVTMSYGVMFFLYASFLGKKGSDEGVMIGLFIWTFLLMLFLALQMYILAFVRLSVGTMKVMLRVTTGLFLASSFPVFILLQLGVFQALEDE